MRQTQIENMLRNHEQRIAVLEEKLRQTPQKKESVVVKKLEEKEEPIKKSRWLELVKEHGTVKAKEIYAKEKGE